MPLNKTCLQTKHLHANPPWVFVLQLKLDGVSAQAANQEGSLNMLQRVQVNTMFSRTTYSTSARLEHVMIVCIA